MYIYIQTLINLVPDHSDRSLVAPIGVVLSKRSGDRYASTTAFYRSHGRCNPYHDIEMSQCYQLAMIYQITIVDKFTISSAMADDRATCKRTLIVMFWRCVLFMRMCVRGRVYMYVYCLVLFLIVICLCRCMSTCTCMVIV